MAALDFEAAARDDGPGALVAGDGESWLEGAEDDEGVVLNQSVIFLFVDIEKGRVLGRDAFAKRRFDATTNICDKQFSETTEHSVVSWCALAYRKAKPSR